MAGELCQVPHSLFHIFARLRMDAPTAYRILAYVTRPPSLKRRARHRQWPMATFSRPEPFYSYHTTVGETWQYAPQQTRILLGCRDGY